MWGVGITKKKTLPWSICGALKACFVYPWQAKSIICHPVLDGDRFEWWVGAGFWQKNYAKLLGQLTGNLLWLWSPFYHHH